MRIQPNRAQLDYHRDRVSRGYSTIDDILKARKHGFSTWKALEGLLLAIMVEGFSGAIIAHERETAARIFKICKYAWDRMPETYKKGKKLNEDRRDALDFGGSTLYVYTAGSRGVGRSETFHWLHGSEVAFWPDPETTFASAEEAVPRSGHKTRESTPNGRDNFWYDECHAARKGDLYNTKLYWYPWWWGDENFLPMEPGEVFIPSEEELNVIEIAAKQGFRLELGHLKWRRSKKGHPLTGRLFPQEHPEDMETCFLMSGNPIVDPEIISRQITRAEAAFVLEDVWLPGNGRRTVWKKGGKNPRIVAIDVAEGLAHGDWSVMSTWEAAPDGNICLARSMLKCTTDDLAQLAVTEARENNEALIIVERNALGTEVVRKIGNLGYYNQYHQLDGDGETTDRQGWHTNVRTLKVMTEEFVTEANHGNIISNDPVMWGQLMNVRRDELGRPVFPKKRPTDVIIAAMLGNMAREQARQYSGSSASVVSIL